MSENKIVYNINITFTLIHMRTNLVDSNPVKNVSLNMHCNFYIHCKLIKLQSKNMLNSQFKLKGLKIK